MLKDIALQLWSSIVHDPDDTLTWDDFKRVFSTAWLTHNFEVEVLVQWRNVNERDCIVKKDCTKKFWNAS